MKTNILMTWRYLYKMLNIFNFYYMIGANMAMRSNVYHNIGGHSDISLLDDYDLSIKLFKNGSYIRYDPVQVVYTSSRRARKLLTYGMTVAYGHYNYMISKDYDKLLNYPKVEEMTAKDILRDNRVGRGILDSTEMLQTSLQQTIKKII